MSSDLLLIGSAPLEIAEDVFKTVGAPLADALGSVPDGEVGERRWWVHRLSYQVFHGHPELETIRRPVPDNGVERLVPHDRSDTWQFKVKSDVPVVRFGNLGWRLGFTSDAMHSYFVFKTLRQQGVLPKTSALPDFAAAGEQRPAERTIPGAGRSGKDQDRLRASSRRRDHNDHEPASTRRHRAAMGSARTMLLGGN